MSRRPWGDMLRDPVLIVGTVTSVGLGVLFYARSDMKTALGVFAALLGVVISLQIQAILLSQRKIDNASRYARIENAFDEIDWLAPLAENIVNMAARVNASHPGTPGVDLCQQIIHECQRRLTDLQRGHYEPIYGDQSLFHDMTSRARTSIRATSAQGVDLSWWASSRSQEYWRLQEEAIGRKVAITRIFIYRDWPPDLERLAANQHRAGIDVRRIRSDQLPADLNTDIVIWDELCGYETRSNAAGEAVQNFFTLAADDIRELTTKFNRILTIAETYAPQIPAP
jgi:hypothetical protein